MQQTQISQGTSYYLKFIEQYPTVSDLAQADEQDVLHLWQGLGYYSRARNLHQAAKYIVNECKGNFPTSYADLLKLKGVGDYTAAAISSVISGELKVALDGNVIRVVSRIFGISEPINTGSGKKLLKTQAEKLISKTRPGDFNQAMMDFGATFCKVKNPHCDSCPFLSECVAYQTNTIDSLPAKIKSKAKTNEHIRYFIPVYQDKIIIRKRKKGIWQNLYDFPSIVSKTKLSDADAVLKFSKKFNISSKNEFRIFDFEIKHVLSHKNLYIRFYKVIFSQKKEFDFLLNADDGLAVSVSDLPAYPYPVVILNFLKSDIL